MSADSIKQYTVSVGADINSQQFDRVTKALNNLNTQIDSIARNASVAGELVTSFVKPFQSLSTSAREAQGGFKAFAEGICNVNKSVSGVQKEIKDASNSIKELMAAFFFVPNIAKGFQHAFERVGGVVKKLLVAPFTFFGNVANGTVNKVKGAVVGLANKIKSTVTGLLHGIQMGFKSMVEGGKRHLRDLGNAFKEWGHMGEKAYKQFTGFLQQTARQDLEMQKLSNRFLVSKQSMMAYQTALESLGASVDDISLSPELSNQFEQLRKDGLSLSRTSGFDDSMKFMRSVVFQFTRLQNISRYATQIIASSIIKNIFKPLGDTRTILKRINAFAIKYIPAISTIIGRVFGRVMNVLQNVFSFTTQVPKFIANIWQTMPAWAKKAMAGAGLAGLLVFGASNPLVAIGAVIAGAMLLIHSFVKWQQGEKDLLTPIWDLLAKKYRETMKHLRSWITQLKDKVVKYIVNELYPQIKLVWNRITGLTGNATKNIGESIKTIVKHSEIAIKGISELVQKAIFLSRMMRKKEDGGLGFMGTAQMMVTDFDTQFNAWQKDPEKYESNLKERHIDSKIRKNLRNQKEDQFDDYFVEYGSKSKLFTPSLLKSVVNRESSFDPSAKNGVHIGLAQANPDTFKEVMPGSRSSDRYKAKESIEFMSKYLNQIDSKYYRGLGLDRDSSDKNNYYRIALALLGYNSGPSKIAGLIEAARKAGCNTNKDIYKYVIKNLEDPKGSRKYAESILADSRKRFAGLSDPDNIDRNRNLAVLGKLRLAEAGGKPNLKDLDTAGMTVYSTANIPQSGAVNTIRSGQIGTFAPSYTQTGSNTCGIAACASVANLINDNNNLNEFSYANGTSLMSVLENATRDSNGKKQYTFISDSANDMGSNNKKSSWTKIESSLKNGVPVIIGLGGQPFTTGQQGGHYMIIDAIEGGNVHLTDGTGKTNWYTKSQIEQDLGHSDSGVYGNKVLVFMSPASQKKFAVNRAKKQSASMPLMSASGFMPLQGSFGMSSGAGGLAPILSNAYEGITAMAGNIGQMAGGMINSGLSYIGEGNGGIQGGLNVGSINVSVMVQKTNAQPQEIGDVVATSLVNRLNYFAMSRGIGLA